MESDEIIDAKISASYMKVAQLHVTCNRYNANRKGMRFFENILQKEGDINCDIKTPSGVVDSERYFSVLHSAYSMSSSANDFSNDVYQLFLNRGADYKIKDNENRTVVHRAIHDHRKDLEKLRRFVDPVLSAHVKSVDSSNPRCKYGISHFHAACMTNHAEAVELFLKNEVPVDEAVNADSPIFAGFTPLHFAVKYSSLEAAAILLKYGAEVHLKNAAGMSSMHVLIKQKMNESRRATEATYETREKLIKLLLDHNMKRNAVDEFGFPNLYVACILDDSSIAEGILAGESLNVNQAVNADSPICAGYTPLHFAAIFNINTVKSLLKKGADIEAKDAENVTPFDLCLKNRSIEEIHYIISSQTKWKDIKLSDGKTRLLDVVSAMECTDRFSKFLSDFESLTDLKIPTESSMWPGYTMLHLAVMFSEKTGGQISYDHWTGETKNVKECLDRGGADITKKDASNATALHLAFYLRKFRTVKVLLEHGSSAVENPLDDNNLSHFHIACATGDGKAVERFSSNGVDINVPFTSTIKWVILYDHSRFKPRQLFLTAGSTALHISVACGHVNVTEKLVEKGANIQAKDCNGLTPIHRLLTVRNPSRKIGRLLLGIDGLQDTIAPCGISYLHVACHFKIYVEVERLLDSGADINASVKETSSKEAGEEEEDDSHDIYGDPSKETLSFLSRYSGFTALHFSRLGMNSSIPELLIAKRADVLLENLCKRASDLDEEEVFKYLTYSSSDSRNRFQKKLGIPSLHIACYSKNLQLMSASLSQGEDVNARLSISPRNTPLHILVKRYNELEEDDTRLIEFLLKNGADVTLRNDNGDTALDMFSLRKLGYPSVLKSAHLMLDSLKNFDINCVNAQGFSFFHYACMTKAVKVVEKFLENGIDVNRPVDFFGDRFSAGCSPLHLAADYQSHHGIDVALQVKMVELLLKHGADAKAEDAYGNTPLHSAASNRSWHHCRPTLFDTLIRYGADVNAMNADGETALEVLITSRFASWEDIECLLKNTTHVKLYNPITQDRYINDLFVYYQVFCDSEDEVHDNDGSYERYENEQDLSNYKILCQLIASEYVAVIDEEGRNFLQNLLLLGCPNKRQYKELIGLFVKRGCNINHRDNEGRTILHLATGYRHNECVVALLKNGADVNVTDNYGKTAFAYCFDRPYECHSSDRPHLVVNKFVEHLHRMEHWKLYISEANRQFQARALEMLNLDEDELEEFLEDTENLTNIEMGSSGLTLFDFIEMDAEMVYPCMPHSVRLEIDQFFEHIDQHNLQLDYLLKLKHDRAREKMRLMSVAIEPLIVIIKNQLPALCCRLILSYLSCVDLENVTAAMKD